MNNVVYINHLKNIQKISIHILFDMIINKDNNIKRFWGYFFFNEKEKKKIVIMIHPQVHLRIPCYDFYFLYLARFTQILHNKLALPESKASESYES